MTSVFDGMAQIFADTFGAEDGTAFYTPPGGGAMPCRPIVTDADPDSAEFAAKPRLAGKVVSVLKSEVAEPVKDGVFTIAGVSYAVVGRPVLELPERAM